MPDYKKINVYLDRELWEQMQRAPRDVSWSAVARKAFEAELRRLERQGRLLPPASKRKTK